jgi:hypothetical protein
MLKPSPGVKQDPTEFVFFRENVFKYLKENVHLERSKSETLQIHA